MIWSWNTIVLLYCGVLSLLYLLCAESSLFHCLQGLVFDLEKNSTLYIDLAKSNSRSKRSRIGDLRVGFPLSLCFYLFWYDGILFVKSWGTQLCELVKHDNQMMKDLGQRRG